MTYCIYYHCPHCKRPDCGSEPGEKGNELVDVRNKTEARDLFNTYKPCRHMKIISIEKYDPHWRITKIE